MQNFLPWSLSYHLILKNRHPFRLVSFFMSRTPGYFQTDFRLPHFGLLEKMASKGGVLSSAGVEESTVQRKLCKVKSERKEVFGGAEGTSQ